MNQPRNLNTKRRSDRTRNTLLFVAGGAVILCVLVVIVAVGGYLIFHNRGTPVAAGGSPVAGVMPAEFASLGSLATVTDARAFDVDQNAKNLPLGNGMNLQVPAGAFPASNQLTLTTVQVAFDQLSFDVKASNFYVLSPRDEVGTLDAPLVLNLPIPEGDTSIFISDGQNWIPVSGVAGQDARVEISHFSNYLWSYLEYRSEQDLKEQMATNPELSGPQIKIQKFLEKSTDPVLRGFFGVGEAATQSQDQMCAELMEVLAQYNTTDNRKFPSASGPLNLDLIGFLFDGKPPEDSGGYYWELTQSAQDQINAKVLASNTLLSPAEVLKISINAMGGNIPMGVLAAHNYLKQIKYQGLYDYHRDKPFPPRWGDPASHLASWRTGSNITPAGDYDKMGPIYHIFAAMTAGLWFPTRLGGDIAINGEAMLRTFQHGGDRPDLQKAAADACGDDAAVWLNNTPPGSIAAQPSSGTNPPQPPASGQEVTLTGTISPTGMDPGHNVSVNTFSLTYRTDGQGTVTGSGKYSTTYTWDCGKELPQNIRWELTGTFDPASSTFSGSMLEYISGQMTYSDCSIGDTPEFQSGDGTWTATLESGVVLGIIMLNQTNYPQVERIRFTVR